MEQNIAAAVTSQVTWEFIRWYVLPMILGSYAFGAAAFGFAWRSFNQVRKEATAGRKDLWDALREVRSNDIKHLQDEINELKQGRR